MDTATTTVTRDDTKSHPIAPHPVHGGASSHGSSTPPLTADEEKDRKDLEIVTTESRVPTNTHYYEKGGLRTYGDDEVCLKKSTREEETGS